MIRNAIAIPLKFDGGQNTLSGPLDIEDNQSPNCKNVHTNLAKTLERRNGFSNLATAGSGSEGNGVFDYWKNADTHFLMAYIDNYIYKMDVGDNNKLDGTLDSLTFATRMRNGHMEFEQFNDGGINYLIMATRRRDKLQRWNGVANTTDDLSPDSSMPKPKHIIVWKGFLFCANIENYESRTYYNDVSGAIVDDGDWDALNYQDINTNDGDYISAQAILKGRLYTFKKYSIHRWTYFGGTPLFGIKTAITGVGTKSPGTVKNISHPKYGEILVFLGSDGRFYGFDGSAVIPLSMNIENDNKMSEYNLSMLDRGNLDEACATNYEDKHWYACWLPTGELNNWYVTWDYYTDSWWPNDGMDAQACGEVESGGKRNVYFIQTDGKVNRFDDGNDDGGTAITAIYDTKRLNYNDQSILKGQRYIDMQFKNVPPTTVSFYSRSDWTHLWGTAESLSCNGGGFILGTSILGTGTLGGPSAVTKTVDLPVVNHHEQFRFKTSDSDLPWQVYGAAVVASGKGYGKSG